MPNDKAFTPTTPPTERIESDVTIHVGEWYWVKDKEDEEEEFMCVMHIGSNYAELENIRRGSCRVHFNHFFSVCRKEKHPDDIITKNVGLSQKSVCDTIHKIESTMRELGVSAATSDATSERALVPLSSTKNVDQYKRALIVAKEETIPQLQEQLKERTSKA